jgi:hypothetical protein
MLTEMDSRDAPKARDRPALKLQAKSDLYAAPSFTISPLPAPSGSELFTHELAKSPQTNSISFGREPMKLGVDGTIRVPPGITAIRVEVASATALHLRTAWRVSDEFDYAVTVYADNDPKAANKSYRKQYERRSQPNMECGYDR